MDDKENYIPHVEQTMPNEKSHRKMVFTIVIIVVVVFVALGLASFYLFTDDNESPQLNVDTNENESVVEEIHEEAVEPLTVEKKNEVLSVLESNPEELGTDVRKEILQEIGNNKEEGQGLSEEARLERLQILKALSS